MEWIKKEWKTLVIALWLIGITVYLVTIKKQLTDSMHQEIQARSTLDSVESIAISTDANIAGIVKKVDGINSNVEFVVSKMRRR